MRDGNLTTLSHSSCSAAVTLSEVSDAGNGGQVLLDATTFSKIKEELAPLGVVDANGIDYAQLEATRPFSLWQALCGRKREWRMGGGRWD